MTTTNSYKAREFNLSGLNGISDQTLEMHFKLYEGYVKETNKLTEAIDKFIQDGQVDQEAFLAPSFAAVAMAGDEMRMSRPIAIERGSKCSTYARAMRYAPSSSSSLG